MIRVDRRKRSTKERWISDWAPDRLVDPQDLQNQWRECSHFGLGRPTEGRTQESQRASFRHEVDEVISSMSKKPENSILENLSRMQLQRCEDLKFVVQ